MTVICSIVAFVVGVLAGSILASEYCRKVMWNQSLQVEKQAILIKQFQEAARPIIEEMIAAGDDTDWSNGPETHRVCYWHEIEPLVKVLELINQDTTLRLWIIPNASNSPS